MRCSVSRLHDRYTHNGVSDGFKQCQRLASGQDDFRAFLRNSAFRDWYLFTVFTSDFLTAWLPILDSDGGAVGDQSIESTVRGVGATEIIEQLGARAARFAVRIKQFLLDALALRNGRHEAILSDHG